MLQRMRVIVLGLVAALVVSACADTFTFHGHTPSDEQLAELNVGRDDRARVEELFGRPAAESLMREEAYYYISYKIRTSGFGRPETIDRQLVRVSFRSNGRVDNIERFTLEDGQVVTLSRRITETNVKGISFIQQALSNLGRINPGNFLN